MGISLASIAMLFVASDLAYAQDVSQELLVRYHRGARPVFTGALTSYRYSGRLEGLEHLKFVSPADAVRAHALLSQSPAVEYVEFNRMITLGDATTVDETRLCFIPGVSVLCFQGPPPVYSPEKVRPFLRPAFTFEQPNGIADPWRAKQYGLRKIRAASAWAKLRHQKPVVVAILDSGVDYNHEDLALNLWRNPESGLDEDAVGYDFVHNDNLPFDDYGHGTHIAGIIGAVANNGVGVTGVSPRVEMMSLKFIPAKGNATTANAIRAIDYAVQHGARIINNSWYIRSLGEDRAFQDAVESAHQSGVLVVASAGNDGVDMDGHDGFLPATLEGTGLIGVVATDSRDQLAPWSNYGAVTTHLAAPGQAIYSTLPGNAYGVKSGTSMAVPHVSGAAAVIWSLHPEWTHMQVRDALFRAVDPLPSLRGKVATGGRLNILRAL